MSGWFVVGVSGVTCGGKSTLTQKLLNSLPSPTHLICQDDFFRPIDSSLHVLAPGFTNHFNWDIITCIDTVKMKTHVQKLLAQKVNDNTQPILLLDGFLLFDDPYLTSICDTKYFLTLNYSQCVARRQLRVYDPPDIPGYFEKCAWPMYEQYLSRVKNSMSGINYLDGSTNFSDIYQQVHGGIMYSLKKT